MKNNKDLVYIFGGLCIFLILFIGIIVVVFSLPSFSYVRNDCSKVIKSQQNVDIQPLVDLDLNIIQGMTSAVKDGFSKYYDVATPPSYDYGNVASIWLYNRRQGNSDEYIINLYLDNINAYQQICPQAMDQYNPNGFSIGVDGDTKYCISYIQQLLSDPVGGCQPIERYTSYVVIEKGDFVVKITEFTSTKESKAKDEIIRLLAEILRGE
jgi:hypothetical protein